MHIVSDMRRSEVHLRTVSVQVLLNDTSRYGDGRKVFRIRTSDLCSIYGTVWYDVVRW